MLEEFWRNSLKEFVLGGISKKILGGIPQEFWWNSTGLEEFCGIPWRNSSGILGEFPRFGGILLEEFLEEFLGGIPPEFWRNSTGLKEF